MKTAWRHGATAIASLALAFSAAVGVPAGATAGRVLDEPREATVWDPLGDVDTSYNDPVRREGLQIDMRWIRYRTYWHRGHRMLSVRAKVADAWTRMERAVTQWWVTDIESNLRGNRRLRLLVIAYNSDTELELRISNQENAAYTAERERHWVNTKRNIVGFAISTEAFRRFESMRATTATLSVSPDRGLDSDQYNYKDLSKYSRWISRTH